MPNKIDDGLTPNQRYYRKNIEKNRARSREVVQAWRQANPERARELVRESYARHAEERRAEKRAAFQALKAGGYSDAHRLKDRLSKRSRAALMRTATNPLTEVDWATICEAYDHRCAYCGVVAPLEQEHVIPLTRGGTHTADNVVPSCKPCNSAKGNRTAAEWLLGSA